MLAYRRLYNIAVRESTPKTRSQWVYHKTVVHLRKTEAGIQAIYMDSIGNQKYIPLASGAIDRALQGVNVVHFIPKFPEMYRDYGDQGEEIVKYAGLQVDDHMCGVFAFKIARVFTSRNHPDLDKQLGNAAGDTSTKQYDMPYDFLKASQSKTHRGKFLEQGVQHESIVPKRQDSMRTWESHMEKYPEPRTYIAKFAKKYLEMVRNSCKSKGSLALNTQAQDYLARNVTKEMLEERSTTPKQSPSTRANL